MNFLIRKRVKNEEVKIVREDRKKLEIEIEIKGVKITI